MREKGGANFLTRSPPVAGEFPWVAFYSLLVRERAAAVTSNKIMKNVRFFCQAPGKVVSNYLQSVVLA